MLIWWISGPVEVSRGALSKAASRRFIERSCHGAQPDLLVCAGGYNQTAFSFCIVGKKPSATSSSGGSGFAK